MVVVMASLRLVHRHLVSSSLSRLRTVRLPDPATVGIRACAVPAVTPEQGAPKVFRQKLLNGEEEVLTEEQKEEKDRIIKELRKRLSGPLADEDGNVPTGKDRPIAIEVDGPSHFYANSKRYTAYTKLKHRLLTRMGYKVLHVPFFEWRRLRGAKEREEYMRQKLLEEPTEWLDPEDEKFYNAPLDEQELAQESPAASSSAAPSFLSTPPPPPPARAKKSAPAKEGAVVERPSPPPRRSRCWKRTPWTGHDPVWRVAANANLRLHFHCCGAEHDLHLGPVHGVRFQHLDRQLCVARQQRLLHGGCRDPHRQELGHGQRDCDHHVHAPDRVRILHDQHVLLVQGGCTACPDADGSGRHAQRQVCQDGADGGDLGVH